MCGKEAFEQTTLNFGRCSEKMSLLERKSVLWKGDLAHLRFPDSSALSAFVPGFKPALVWRSKMHSTHETPKTWSKFGKMCFSHETKQFVFSRKD